MDDLRICFSKQKINSLAAELIVHQLIIDEWKEHGNFEPLKNMSYLLFGSCFKFKFGSC